MKRKTVTLNKFNLLGVRNTKRIICTVYVQATLQKLNIKMFLWNEDWNSIEIPFRFMNQSAYNRKHNFHEIYQ